MCVYLFYHMKRNTFLLNYREIHLSENTIPYYDVDYEEPSYKHQQAQIC